MRRAVAVQALVLLIASEARGQELGPDQVVVPDQRLLDALRPLERARGSWERQGIELELEYAGELLSLVRGGATTDEATRYGGLLELDVALETGPAGLWEGGRFALGLLERHGRSIAERAGVYQELSGLEAPDDEPFTRLGLATFRQELLDERLWVEVGKRDAADLFTPSRTATPFLHSSAGNPPNVPLPTYPDPDLGAVVGVEWPEQAALLAGVFQGDPTAGAPSATPSPSSAAPCSSSSSTSSSRSGGCRVGCASAAGGTAPAPTRPARGRAAAG